MYQVNVLYKNELMEIIYDCINIEEASKIRYNKIKKWFDKKMKEGINPAEINELLDVEIKEM